MYEPIVANILQRLGTNLSAAYGSESLVTNAVDQSPLVGPSIDNIGDGASRPLSLNEAPTANSDEEMQLTDGICDALRSIEPTRAEPSCFGSCGLSQNALDMAASAGLSHVAAGQFVQTPEELLVTPSLDPVYVGSANAGTQNPAHNAGDQHGRSQNFARTQLDPAFLVTPAL